MADSTDHGGAPPTPDAVPLRRSSDRLGHAVTVLAQAKEYWVQVTAVCGLVGSLVTGVFYAGKEISRLEGALELEQKAHAADKQRLEDRLAIMDRTYKVVVRYVAATLFDDDVEAREFVQTFDAELTQFLDHARGPGTKLFLGIPGIMAGGGRHLWVPRPKLPARVKSQDRWQAYLRAKEMLQQEAQSRGYEIVPQDTGRIRIEQKGVGLEIPGLPELVPPCVSAPRTDPTSCTLHPTGSVTSSVPTTTTTEVGHGRR